MRGISWLTVVHSLCLYDGGIGDKQYYMTPFKANGTFSNVISCRGFSYSSVVGGTLRIKYKVFNITTDSWSFWLLLGGIPSTRPLYPPCAFFLPISLLCLRYLLINLYLILIKRWESIILEILTTGQFPPPIFVNELALTQVL